MPSTRERSNIERRAAAHGALSVPARLAIIDELIVSDRTPKELSQRLGIPSNLLAHHLDVLEAEDLIERGVSAADQRRRYVRLAQHNFDSLMIATPTTPRRVLFVCSHNSARSQLAAALWTRHTGTPATSAGTHPASRVHRGAVSAAKRAGLDLTTASPKPLGAIPTATQVITVCDRVHEELEPHGSWWHWSIADPVDEATPAAFDAVVAELRARITAITSISRKDTPASKAKPKGTA